MTGRAIFARSATAAVLAAGAVMVGAAESVAEPRHGTAALPVTCLWAGAPYPRGTTVAAGGSNFTCGVDHAGPYWLRGPAAADAVAANPGADAAPEGRFSPGARQPGTSYTDYCVGAQLIPGSDDIYQVVALSDGTRLWKAAAPISQWRFASEDPRPAPTWRTDALCVDGMLT
ncbi:hypothetical protein [Nocardia bovistercoris]|uniref:Secreted protein n=1 Tax=Nocardia bovistercoris TaxID=2785916 RepID=A0A931N2J9_9NOCA|nr:hypothetical protein [Nocardia bovistercoris]MBH0776121.1 hypothetical protein [Nocardia bovistercoris]